MKILKNNLINKFLIFIFVNILYFLIGYKFFNNKIKISICTMGKNENLYIKEFVEY